MAVTINASTTAGLVNTADTSGILQLQTANTTAVTVDASQNVSTTNGATIQGLTVGRGAGAVATNTAVGGSALAANTSGASNVAIGYTAMQVSTTAASNTAIGYQALQGLSTGANNTCIGLNAGADSGVVNISTQSNYIAIGNNTNTNAYIKIAWTVTSDARDKTEVNPVPHGLNFVNQLNPVSFKFRKSRSDATPTGDVRYGFLAQDILAIEGSDSVVIDSKDADNLKYTDQNMTAILVKAIQEQQALITQLQADVATLKGTP
jgi:hypothetical protein